MTSKFYVLKQTIIVIFALITIMSANAEQTTKTVELPLGYEALALTNSIHYYNLSVDFPDGISRVIAMEILVQGDYSANTITTAGFLYEDIVVYCTPQTWTIYITSNNYEMNFDCTPLLQAVNWTGGDLQFVMTSNQVSANIKTRVRISYYNNPPIIIQPPSLSVAGTDYVSNESGKTFLQLSESGVEVNNATCWVTIFNPNASIWVEDQLMINQGSHGLQYYPFITPNIEGIYMISAKCQYFTSDVWFYSFDDIHSSNRTIILADAIIGSTRNLNDYDDNSYTELDSEKVGGDFFSEVEYLFNDSDNNFANFTNMHLVYSGKSTKNALLEFKWWNWSDSTWNNLSQNLLFVGQGSLAETIKTGSDQYVTNMLPDNAFSNGAIKVKLYGIFNNNFFLLSNWLNIRGDKLNNNSISFLRGGGEIHISNPDAIIIEYLSNISNATITLLNGTPASSSPSFNSSLYYTNQSVDRTPILETQSMRFNITTLLNTSFSSEFKVTYTFYDESDVLQSTVIEEFLGLDNHQLTVSSAELMPSGIGENYAVYSVVSIKDSNGNWFDFDVELIGTQRIESLTNNGATTNQTILDKVTSNAITGLTFLERAKVIGTSDLLFLFGLILLLAVLLFLLFVKNKRKRRREQKQNYHD